MKRLLSVAALLALSSPVFGQDVDRLYADHCAACHGGDRLGAIGPALLPDNLGRMKAAEAEKIIANGRPATQMPPFKEVLNPEQIGSLAKMVLSPLPAIPHWEMAEIRATHQIVTKAETLPAQPPFASDPLNLFTVVEGGDHHVTILDGDRMEPLYRFASRFALHGGAKYSPDGRFVYLMSRDGWVSKVDMWTGSLMAEIRAGINSRNIAVSDDGRYVAVGNGLPHTLVMLDAADLSPLAVLPVADRKGASSRVSAVYTAPPRHSFVVALKDVPELWEIPYGKHEPIFNGFVHNYEAGMAEGLADQRQFPVRHIQLSDPLDDFFFDPPYQNVMGAARDGQKGRVVSLVTGGEIATLDLAGMPHLGSGIVFRQDGRLLMATPHLKDPVVSIIDMKTWQTVKRIPTLGPGFFMRGHENSPYAWVDVSMGTEKDALQIIDTRTLEVVKTIRPAPGHLTRHVEFSRDGRYALVSLSENDGALLVLDADSFQEIKRIPMVGPIGKYNVFNKINFSAGTSH